MVRVLKESSEERPAPGARGIFKELGSNKYFFQKKESNEESSGKISQLVTLLFGGTRPRPRDSAWPGAHACGLFGRGGGGGGY